MNPFDETLRRQLELTRQAGLYRELRPIDSPQGANPRVGGQALVNFPANDYLGLASHPALKEAAVQATSEFGAGAGASRLISGSLRVHHQLEDCLAAFKGTEAALTFSSGYATAVGTITALVGRNDFIILDKLV